MWERSFCCAPLRRQRQQRRHVDLGTADLGADPGPRLDQHLQRPFVQRGEPHVEEAAAPVRVRQKTVPHGGEKHRLAGACGVRDDDDALRGMCVLKRDGLPDVDVGCALLPQFRGAGYAHGLATARR
jgi:hypothetical protein